jgi:Domain of unknown function (DUF4382)
MEHMRTYRRSWLALLPLVLLVGCSDDDTPSGVGTGTMRVRMTDAPAAVEAVNLVVIEVTARTEDASGVDSLSGWQTLNATAKTYNLMDLQNGVFTTIAEAQVPAGTYTEVRLKLGAGSTIVVDGQTYPLTVPSGMQSGLKLKGSFVVPSGGISDIALDFDASRSIVLTGSGTYILKPVIQVLPMPTAGSIRGTVQPTTAATAVLAMQGADTLGTAVPAVDGRFTISVLPPGAYSVFFDGAAGYRDTTLTNILVTAGVSTDVDTVQMTSVQMTLQ